MQLESLVARRSPEALCRPAQQHSETHLRCQVQSQVEDHSVWKQNEDRKSQLSNKAAEVPMAPSGGHPLLRHPASFALHAQLLPPGSMVSGVTLTSWTP